MSEALWKWGRELLRGPDRLRAHAVEAETLRRTEAEAVPLTLRQEQAALRGRAAGVLRLGRFSEGPLRNEDLLVDMKRLLAHQLLLGATGSGKTYQLLLQLLAVLRASLARPGGVELRSAVVLDMKDEFTELLTQVALPAVAASLPPAEADAFLRRIVVIDPFSPTHPPPLNVLARDPGQPLGIQARDVAECFQAATESDVSVRMETILDWVLRLVIETGGTFRAVRRALQEPAVLDGLVRAAKDPDTVRYFLTRYPAEPKASKLALLSRLDRFLALPMTELALGAKHCFDFDRLLEDRITIVSLGKAPAGLQSVARFFAMVVFTRFVRAIFRRPPRSQGFQSLIVADEWQAALNPSLAGEFESILTLARSRGVHLWLANQQLGQLDRYGSSLKAVVLGQTAVQTYFRMADDDARALRRMLPATGTVRRKAVAGQPGGSPFLTASEEADMRMNTAGRLPDREGYFNDRRQPWGAVPFRSATVALPAAGSLAPTYVARARRGAVAFTAAELEAMCRDEDDRLDRMAAGPARKAPAPVPTAPAIPPVRAPVPSAPLPPRPAPPPAARTKKPRRGRGGGGLPPIR